MGEELPSVKAGTPYVIYGNSMSRHDYSTVVLPSDTRRCTFCHEQNTGAAQKTAYLKPTINACGACHDNVNFATGANQERAAVFDEMPSEVSYADGTLGIQRRWDFETSLDGKGLVLEPLAFATPRVFVMLDEPYQPTLCYPPRGIATLWDASAGETSGAGLGALLGGRRASILRALEVPLTTTDLAERVGVTPAAVSQQLGQLRDAGLVTAQRDGPRVYSRITKRGEELLKLFAAA